MLIDLRLLVNTIETIASLWLLFQMIASPGSSWIIDIPGISYRLFLQMVCHRS